MRSLSVPAIALGCLCAGLLAGGFRDPLLWTSAAAVIWLAAFASAPPSSPTVVPWALWFCWALISTLACGQPLKSVYSFSRWLTLIVLFHTAAEHWTERCSKRWLFWLAPCVLILGASTFFIEGTVHPMTGLMPPYYNYTVFAEAAFVAAAMAAAGHRAGPSGAARWTLWGLAVFAVSLIIKARSRSGLLAVSAAAAFWLYRRGKVKWLAWGTLALAVMALLDPWGVSSYVLKLDLSAWFKRPQIWTAALRIAADHPLLGEGLGNFEQGFLRHNFASLWAVNYGFTSPHAHNEFLELAAATGWVGLGLFLSALYKSFRPAYSGAESPWREAGLYAFIAMTTQCLADNMLHMPALAMLYFTALICMGAPAGPPVRPKSVAIGVRPWRIFCAAGFVLSAMSFVPQALVGRGLELYRREPGSARTLSALSRAVRIFPADYYLRETMARALLAADPPRPDAAFEQLAIASELSPTNALVHMMRAEISFRRSDMSGALELLDRSIELEPNFLNARLLRAAIRAGSGNKKAARTELDEIRKRRLLLKDMPLYSGYGRIITALDKGRFAAVAAKASYR